MARKKSEKNVRKKDFICNPFSHLKGFSVPVSETSKALEKPAPDPPAAEDGCSFEQEMAQLGVKPLNPEAAAAHGANPVEGVEETAGESAELTEEELFLAEMSQLQVRFEDSFVDAEDEPAVASSRRLKQLKQGKIVPDATLDLHGLTRPEVAPKLDRFLHNARHHHWQTLLVITGKGLHSEGGEAVLRQETERYLTGPGRAEVAEWHQSPARYGGAGALVLFLKKQAPA